MLLSWNPHLIILDICPDIRSGCLHIDRNHTLTFLSFLLIGNTPRGTRTLISGNLSPVHMPILLQGCSPPTRIELAHSVIGNPSDFLSHLLRRFGSTIRCSAIKLRRTCGMRESNSHGLCPAVFETAPSTYSGNPAHCTKGDSNS